MKIFLKTLILILTPILTVFILSYFIVNNNVNNNLNNYLEQDTKAKFEIVKHDFESSRLNIKKLYNIYSKTYKKTHLRITLIKKNGKVVFDSSVPFNYIDKMENHKHRPEIQHALLYKEGFSKRFSKTKKMYMMYYAKLIPNDNILRISYPLSYINSIKSSFDNSIYFTFLSSMAILILTSIFIAQKLSLPIQKLNYIVEAIRNGKNIHFPHFKDKNLAKVSALIYEIYNAMKDKQKETELEKQKLEYILESMEEGVLLLSSDFKYIHSNPKFNKIFPIDTKKQGENMLSLLKNPDTIAAFSDIFQQRGLHTIKLNNRTFKIYSKEIDNFLLFVFEDIEEKAQYEYFKSELVGNISHELKTPISTIASYAETLLMDNNIDKKTKTEFTQKIYEGVLRLDGLLDDIMELHRLENFRLEDVNEEIELNDIKDELEKLFKESSKNLNFNFKLKKVNILKEHLISILTNLISNAVKYSKGDNVYISIKPGEKGFKIIVDDEGPVIPQKERERIFERFYTCSKSRNRKKSGTGLGLSIVKHIAVLYKGFVELKQNSYSGNSFVVYINTNL